jgi:hypothetical protein
VDSNFSSFSYFIGLYRSLEASLLDKPRDSEQEVKSITTCADAAIGAFKSFCSSTNRHLMTEKAILDSYMLKANFGIVV